MNKYTYCILDENKNKTFLDSDLNEEDYQKTYPDHQILHIYQTSFDETAYKTQALEMFHDHA